MYGILADYHAMCHAWIVYINCSEVGAKYREELKKLQEEAEKV